MDADILQPGAGHLEPATCHLPPAAWNLRLRRKLLDWYAGHARDLPWRRTRDPYAIWISEVMLQQTQVETVKAYYLRFMQQFPTLRALAAAEEASVLRVWEGLGYYRRARQLHAAARQIVSDFGGHFPREIESACQLPGIGRYTAGAILSIAYAQRQPILEANTLRLFSRLLGYQADPRRAAGQRLLWQFAEAILPRSDCGNFNQALMELGSTVCLPHAPACDHCPLAELCVARAHGWQTRIPGPVKRLRYEQLYETAVIVRRGSDVLLRQCGEGERWAGLWDFPRLEHDAQKSTEVQLYGRLHQLTGVHVQFDRQLAVVKHGVTRFRITLTCVSATYRSGRLRATSGCRWVPPQTLDQFPLSSTGRQLSRLVISNV